MVGRWQVNDQLMPNLHYSGHLCFTCSFQGNQGTSISCSCTSSRLLKPFGPQVSLHRSSKWLLGHSGSHTRCLRKLGGDDLDERVIPLHITSFIKGLSWPSKEDGQWSFNPPQPPILRPLFPFPLCPTPSPSLLTQGVVQKRVKFKNCLSFLWGLCIAGRERMIAALRGQGH